MFTYCRQTLLSFDPKKTDCCSSPIEPPCFLEPLKDKTIIERWGGRLDCRVDGIPYPEVKWFKDWHPIIDSQRMEITNVPPDGHGLTIRNAIMRDEGMYTVVAKNVAGEVHCNCTVDVARTLIHVFLNLYKPRIKNIPCPK